MAFGRGCGLLALCIRDQSDVCIRNAFVARLRLSLAFSLLDKGVVEFVSLRHCGVPTFRLLTVLLFAMGSWIAPISAQWEWTSLTQTPKTGHKLA